MGISLTTLDWQYMTVPQKNLNSRNITMHAGRVLGGSSTINAMVFVSFVCVLVFATS